MNVKGLAYFEQKVKITDAGFCYLHFVQKRYKNVYTLSLFNLLSSHIHGDIFTQQTQNFVLRSYDSHVHFAQISNSIFYALADCTNF